MPYDLLERKAAAKRAVKKYRQSEKGKATACNRRRAGQLSRPFVGVDGEGGSVNEHGQQNYLLLRAGESYLFDGNARLPTRDCLDFILALDAGPLYIAYYFDYDCTQILRDIPLAKLNAILNRSKRDFRNEGHSPAECWEDYAIEWHPRKHLAVSRLDRASNRIVKGSRRVVHDVGTFFQCSFVKALTDWNIGTAEEREFIAAQKGRRTEFTEMTAVEIEYNFRECELLADLMTAFREVCEEIGYIPRLWEGPGYLASAMLEAHGVMKAKELKLDEALYTAANDAYYGGRFEIFKVGEVEDVREFDICSAYPAAYLGLPCLRSDCTAWKRTFNVPSSARLDLAKVRFAHPADTPIVCHLPVRLKSGTLQWPREGIGWYWSTELEAAVSAGTKIAEWIEVWEYECTCTHSPFGEWVQEVYDERQRIGKSVRGYPLKLALNSVYGKCCQSIGRPAFANAIWGGLITADVRRRLINAYSKLEPDNLVMLATDGLYCVGEGPELNIGSDLGEWEVKSPDTIFVIKPGMYAWNNGVKVKTRGVPKDLFEAGFPDMQQAWGLFFHRLRKAEAENTLPLWVEMMERNKTIWPSYSFPMTVFVSSRLAVHWGKAETAGVWQVREATHSFDPCRKRRPGELVETSSGFGHMNTYAHLGGPFHESVYYSSFKTIGGIRHRAGPITISEYEAAVDQWNLFVEGLPEHVAHDDDFDSASVTIDDIM